MSHNFLLFSTCRLSKPEVSCCPRKREKQHSDTLRAIILVSVPEVVDIGEDSNSCQVFRGDITDNISTLVSLFDFKFLVLIHLPHRVVIAPLPSIVPGNLSLKYFHTLETEVHLPLKK